MNSKLSHPELVRREAHDTDHPKDRAKLERGPSHGSPPPKPGEPGPRAARQEACSHPWDRQPGHPGRRPGAVGRDSRPRRSLPERTPGPNSTLTPAPLPVPKGGRLARQDLLRPTATPGDPRVSGSAVPRRDPQERPTGCGRLGETERRGRSTHPAAGHVPLQSGTEVWVSVIGLMAR